MNSFIENIMSDIVHNLRKNREKACIFAIFFAVCAVAAVFLAMRDTVNPYYKTGLFTGLVIGLRAGYGYFIMLMLWNVAALAVLFAATCNAKLLCFWPVLAGVRLILKISDIVCALKFFFFSCVFAAVTALIFEILTAALFFLIYFDLYSKSANVFIAADRELLKDVSLPLAEAVLAVGALQALIAGVLLF